MALIVTAHDLSTGNATSTEVVAPNNWRVTATTTGCPLLQDVFVTFEVEDEQGNWALLTDEKDHPIKMKIRGNSSESRNPIVVNAANGRVIVRPPVGAEGTINIDSINS